MVNLGRIADDAARLEIGEIPDSGECSQNLLRRRAL
jgi:hypothetical protein